jgi:PAS domain S-box-containing protein
MSPETTGAASLEVTSVLLVEDDIDQAELVRRKLERQEPPFEVTVVGDGLAGLEAMTLRSYSVVLLDYSLPRMNGLEVLARIRARGISVPVVMVTGQGDEHVAVEAIKAGALDYVVKTAGYLTALPAVLRKTLKQHGMMQENAQLYSEVQLQLRRTETLLAVSREVGSTLEVAEIVRRTTKELVRALGADMGGFWLLDAGQGFFAPLAGYRVPKDLLELFAGTPVDARNPLFEEVQRCEEAFCAADSQADPMFFTHPLFQAMPHKSVLIVPSRQKGRLIGGFMAVWLHDAHTFTAEELRLAEGISRQAAVAIDNAELFAQSEARRVEAETSEERFRDFIQGLYAIVWNADAATWAFSFVSQRAEATLGYPIEQWLSEPAFWINHLHPDDREHTVAARRAAVAEARAYGAEYRIVAADGRVVWLRDRVHVAKDPESGTLQLRGVMVDFTMRRQAEDALRESEQQLRQAQKMEAIGRLAGGVAHDFNNLLLVISGHTHLLRNDFGDVGALRRRAETIMRATDRAAGLTRQLLAFSRKQTLQPRPLDLNGLVSDTSKMLRRVIGEDIELVLVLGSALGTVRADPGQIEQVIMNLAVNSRDAMPKGGQITIETGNAELDEAFVRGHPGSRPGPQVFLSVRDTGCGMSREIQAQIFEPFFTTKEQGKGTGLGLSTVYGIVKQHDGYISIESEPGRGAAFTTYLPRVEAAADPEDTEPALPAARGSETILLVEDDDSARDLVRQILTKSGYQVMEEASGPKALARCAGAEGSIHLLLTDVVMPELSGPELARRLAPLRPQMKVLYISGYTDDALGQHGALDRGIALLQKPFTPEALAAKVREVLDQTRERNESPVG